MSLSFLLLLLLCLSSFVVANRNFSVKIQNYMDTDDKDSRNANVNEQLQTAITSVADLVEAGKSNDPDKIMRITQHVFQLASLLPFSGAIVAETVGVFIGAIIGAGDPFQSQVMEQLSKLSGQIENLRHEMHARFDELHKVLNQMKDEIKKVPLYVEMLARIANHKGDLKRYGVIAKEATLAMEAKVNHGIPFEMSVCNKLLAHMTDGIGPMLKPFTAVSAPVEYEARHTQLLTSIGVGYLPKLQHTVTKCMNMLDFLGAKGIVYELTRVADEYHKLFEQYVESLPFWTLTYFRVFVANHFNHTEEATVRIQGGTNFRFDLDWMGKTSKKYSGSYKELSSRRLGFRYNNKNYKFQHDLNCDGKENEVAVEATEFFSKAKIQYRCHQRTRYPAVTEYDSCVWGSGAITMTFSTRGPGQCYETLKYVFNNKTVQTHTSDHRFDFRLEIDYHNGKIWHECRITFNYHDGAHPDYPFQPVGGTCEQIRGDHPFGHRNKDDFFYKLFHPYAKLRDDFFV